MVQPWPLFRLFSVFSNKHYHFRQINVKNVHPVSGARIRTHNLLVTSLLPQPLDQGSCQGYESFTVGTLFRTFILIFIYVRIEREKILDKESQTRIYPSCFSSGRKIIEKTLLTFVKNVGLQMLKTIYENFVAS